MAKKVPLHIFLHLFMSGELYTRKEVRELAKHKGYVVPGEFWDEYKISRGKFGILAKPNKVDKYWEDEDFDVEITHNELFHTVKVTHKETKFHGLTTCSKDHVEEKTELLRKALAPHPKQTLED